MPRSPDRSRLRVDRILWVAAIVVATIELLSILSGASAIGAAPQAQTWTSSGGTRGSATSDPGSQIAAAERSLSLGPTPVTGPATMCAPVGLPAMAGHCTVSQARTTARLTPP